MKSVLFLREKLPGWNDPPPLTFNTTGSSSGQGYKLNKRVGYPAATSAAAGTVPGQVNSTVTQPGYVLPLSTPPMVQVSRLSTLILTLVSWSLFLDGLKYVSVVSWLVDFFGVFCIS